MEQTTPILWTEIFLLMKALFVDTGIIYPMLIFQALVLYISVEDLKHKRRKHHNGN